MRFRPRSIKKSGKPLVGAKPGLPVSGGVPCTAYIGTDGSGHYVKMVHNGIEYGDMQMICEAYHILSEIADLEPSEIGEIFRKMECRYFRFISSGNYGRYSKAKRSYNG